jgi:CRP-like cAMP-binding protein
MDEFQAILKNIARFIQLTEEETSYFTGLLRITRVRKKQFIVQPEFVCKYRSYVFHGAMRAYFVDAAGQDHTIAFAIEDWYISDFNSFLFQQPATLFVEALEDSILVQLDYQSEQLLMQQVPKFERFFRIIAQRSLALMQRRMLSNLTMTAEERYNEFIDKYPAIVNKVPQYTLASYLGMTTEFLSKIRNGKLKKS